MNFRLPRKVKKKLKSKILLYPPNSDGSRLMANPISNQEDYDAYKRGELSDLFNRKYKSDFSKFKVPNIITEDQLRQSVNDVFSEQYRSNCLRLLLRGREEESKYYQMYVNAWLLSDDVNNYYNTACMAWDSMKNNFG